MKNCTKPVDRMTDIPYTEPRPINQIVQKNVLKENSGPNIA